MGPSRVRENRPSSAFQAQQLLQFRSSAQYLCGYHQFIIIHRFAFTYMPLMAPLVTIFLVLVFGFWVCMYVCNVFFGCFCNLVCKYFFFFPVNFISLCSFFHFMGIFSKTKKTKCHPATSSSFFLQWVNLICPLVILVLLEERIKPVTVPFFPFPITIQPILYLRYVCMHVP